MKKYLANIITCLRIPGSIVLLFLDALSIPFYIAYLLCGFSDMIDVRVNDVVKVRIIRGGEEMSVSITVDGREHRGVLTERKERGYLDKGILALKFYVFNLIWRRTRLSAVILRNNKW